MSNTQKWLLTLASLVLSTAIPLALSSRIATAEPQGQPSQRQLSQGQLSTEQRQTLKALGIQIAVPNYVPAGFSVANLNTKPCPPQGTGTGNCRFGPSYRILYRNLQRTCFAVDAVGGGLGGADPEYVLPVTTTLLGKTTIGFGKTPGDAKPASPQQLTRAQPNIWSFPAGKSPYFAIATVEGQDGCGPNLSLSPLEIKRILLSFVWL
jgi:hypothetical protein